MKEYSTTRLLASDTGLVVDQRDSRGENFQVERDWGIYRGSGYGLAGADDSGWLVTFAANKISPTGRILGKGYLVAHAVETSPGNSAGIFGVGVDEETEHETPTFGGRCLLLGGPWDEDENDALNQQAAQQDWFKSRMGGATVNVEHLDQWLISMGRGVAKHHA